MNLIITSYLRGVFIFAIAFLGYTSYGQDVINDGRVDKTSFPKLTLSYTQMIRADQGVELIAGAGLGKYQAFLSANRLFHNYRATETAGNEFKLGIRTKLIEYKDQSALMLGVYGKYSDITYSRTSEFIFQAQQYAQIANYDRNALYKAVGVLLSINKAFQKRLVLDAGLDVSIGRLDIDDSLNAVVRRRRGFLEVDRNNNNARRNPGEYNIIQPFLYISLGFILSE